MTYTLLPPNDPRVLSSIAEFDIERFKEDEKIELKEFIKVHLIIWLRRSAYSYFPQHLE